MNTERPVVCRTRKATALAVGAGVMTLVAILAFTVLVALLINDADTANETRRELLDEVEKFNEQYLQTMTRAEAIKNPQRQCSDENRYCGVWAAAGYCSTVYLSNYCRLSCGLCQQQGSSCRDENVYCGDWASRGECSRNPAYMLLRCRKSCQQCTGGGGGGGGTGGGGGGAEGGGDGACKDTREDCLSLAKQGRCRAVSADEEDVSGQCGQSCGLCGRTPGHLLDRHSCARVGPVPGHVADRYRLDTSHYSQYTEAYGFPVTASGSVDPRALMRLCYLVRWAYASLREARRAAHTNFVRFVIIGKNERTTQLPEYRYMSSAWDERARGFGGHVTAAAEENLLGFDKNKWGGMDMALHEVAHNVHLSGLQRGDPSLYREVDNAYSYAMAAGKYYLNGVPQYARTDYREYFAEGVNSYFGDTWWNKPPHDAGQLRRYDPALFDIMTRVFPCNSRQHFVFLHNDIDQSRACCAQVLSRTFRLKMNSPDCEQEPQSSIPAKKDVVLKSGIPGAVYTWSREQCRLPFVYYGTRYSGCTTASQSRSRGAAWCATSVSAAGGGTWQDTSVPSHHNTWGFCAWPDAGGRACEMTRSGGACTFPFVYLGVTHVSCQGTGWCANSTDSDGNMEEWDFCDPSCYSSTEDEARTYDINNLSAG